MRIRIYPLPRYYPSHFLPLFPFSASSFSSFPSSSFSISFTSSFHPLSPFLPPPFSPPLHSPSLLTSLIPFSSSFLYVFTIYRSSLNIHDMVGELGDREERRKMRRRMKRKRIRNYCIQNYVRDKC